MSYEPIKSSRQAHEEAEKLFPMNRFMAPGEVTDMLGFRTLIYIAELLEKVVANTTPVNSKPQVAKGGK